MATIIIKPAKDLDLYVGWSSVVDAPTFWGDRATVADYLREDGQSDEVVYGRLARADEEGTSALYGDPPREGGWSDPSLIYMQGSCGILPRVNLTELIRRLEIDEQDPMTDLLQPFEDEA
jgi:hypothetical protein